MLTDPITTCEMWDLTKPIIPPRSRLYCLEPIGVGTPYVESLTSFITRLAEAHSVRTRRLVVHELLPLLGRAHLSKLVNSSLTTFWSNTRSLNGIRTLANDWVQALETLTLRSDLRFLTLLTWADVLPSKNLQRPTLAWCPNCYQEWRQAKQVVYAPLLWTLRAIEICPRHRRRLQTQCPHLDCQRSQHLLGSRSRLGYCQYCERWLGVTPDPGEIEDQALDESEIEWQRWVTNAIGELLAIAPSLSTLPPRERVAVAVSACVEQASNGKQAVFAREIGISLSPVYNWLNRKSIPQLDFLLRICYYCGISPLQFLTGDIVVDPSRINAPMWDEPSRVAKRTRKPFDADGVQWALEAALESDEHPPPPMREFARRLGYSHSQLHQRFPELCRQISARYIAYRKAQGTQRRQQLCEEVRQAAHAIHARGIYPSSYRIAPLISQPGFVRHPDAMATRHEVLRELGWES